MGIVSQRQSQSICVRCNAIHSKGEVRCSPEPVGPFPGDLQSELAFVGSIALDSKNAAAAKAFVDYLQTPEATAMIKAKGLTPAKQKAGSFRFPLQGVDARHKAGHEIQITAARSPCRKDRR
jgi:hypothetical protein